MTPLSPPERRTMRRPWTFWTGETRKLLNALSALALLLLGVSAEGLHGVVEPHRFCEAHGAVEHVDPHSGHPLEIASAGRESDLQAPSWRATGEGVAHERCALATFAREDSAVLVGSPTVQDAVPPPIHTSTWAPSHRPRSARIPRFRLAPKQSPPA